MVTPRTNPAEVTDQKLWYGNSNAWGRHNSHRSGVISINYQLIFQTEKAPTRTGGTITDLKHFPAALLTQRWPVYSDDNPPQRAVIGLIETVSI